jgi:hypothetical protein
MVSVESSKRAQSMPCNLHRERECMERTQPSMIGVASILVATRHKLDSRGARVEGRSHLRVDSGMYLRGARKKQKGLSNWSRRWRPFMSELWET